MLFTGFRVEEGLGFRGLGYRFSLMLYSSPEFDGGSSDGDEECVIFLPSPLLEGIA